MNKAKLLAVAAAFAIPTLILAVPADPRPRTLKNPDGSKVEVRVHGDERFHFMTDADCKSIMQRNSDGFYVNAVRNGKALLFNAENVKLLRDEARAAAAHPEFLDYTPGEAAMVPAESSMQRMATLNSSGRSTYPTIGEGIRSLVVLVEFQDVDFTVDDPKDYFTRQLNEPGFSEYGGNGSAIDYFKDASHGLYAPQFDVYGPVKVSKNADYFKDNDSGHMALLIREAITQLHDSGELNLADYDYDENGTLDTVFIYYAGYGSADSETETIWPHQYDYQYYVSWMGAPQLRFDGIKVGPYACANELKGWNPNNGRLPWQDGSTPWVDGVGCFIHEYGHVLGLPDLYDVEYSGGVVTPGEWDVMDQGSYNFDGCMPPLYSAYEQWVCNWLEYTDAEDATHYDLLALGNSDSPQAVRIRIPMSASGNNFQSEYFVIEARDNSKWNACFPEPGLMVWRINYKKSVWNSNSVNSVNGSNVEIVYANGEKHPLFETGAIYPGAPVELQPSKDYSMWKSPVISDIVYDKETLTGSFDYNMLTQPEVATVLHDDPKAAADGSRMFTLEWDPVEGVDSYRVTIKTSSGKIVDKFDEKEVGNVTSVTTGKLSNVYWKLDMEAYVRCVVNGMVSSEISNVVLFKPSELAKVGDDPGTAVEGVESEVTLIRGGVGCVIAPEGAVVYNLSGQQLRNENLAPGVYLVSYANSTVKVLVK